MPEENTGGEKEAESIAEKVVKAAADKEKGSVLSKIGGGLGNAFKSIGGFLNTPRSIKTQVAGSVLAGVGFAAGKKVGKGFMAFLRSFFPYDLYDFFILVMIFQHIFIDGVIFGYTYPSQVYMIHLWVAIFFVIIFSIYRDEGEGFLTSFIKNTILFLGIVFTIEAYFFPLISNLLRNPYFMINRIILPIWPIFAIAYASYKRETTTPFIRKVLVLFIIFLALISWPYIEKITENITIPGGSPVETIQAKITLNTILERLKDGSSSFWNSLQGSVINPIIAFINGSWIKQQIQPFQSDTGQYDTNQRALELKVTSARALPSYITDEEKVELKISASFEGLSQKEIPRDIIEKDKDYNVFISKILNKSNNRIIASCDEPVPLLNALSYLTLNCDVNTTDITFNKNNQAQLKAQITYDFYTFAYRDFYFMDEKKLYEYITTDKNPYLEESGFLGGPESTKNSAGPVLIGLSANGEMQNYPIAVSAKNKKHILVLSIKDVGSGKINNITKIVLLLPKELTLNESCYFEKQSEDNSCYTEMNLESTEIKQRYNCWVRKGDNYLMKKMIKNGNEYQLVCSFTIDPTILAGYKNILPLYAKVKYQYIIQSPEINIVKAESLS